MGRVSNRNEKLVIVTGPSGSRRHRVTSRLLGSRAAKVGGAMFRRNQHHPGTPDRKPKLVVLTGPSGAGKDTLARVLLRSVRTLRRVQTCTTRPRMPKDTRYRFLSVRQFAAARKRGDFLEASRVYGLWYGTTRRAIQHVRLTRRVPYLGLDPTGARKVKRLVPTALTVFIRPPSRRELKRRLTSRHRDDPAHIARRLTVADRELRLTGWDAEVENPTGRVREAAGRLIHTVRAYLAA